MQDELCICDGRICLVRGAQPAAEAKNAEGASWTALLIPMPPKETGRDVWSHAWSSERLMLRTAESVERRRQSKSCNLEDEKHGDDLNKYKTLGMAKE